MARGNPAFKKAESFNDREETKEYLFILKNRSKNPPIKGASGYPLRYNILSEVVIPTDKGMKIIRHVPTEKTIWADDQKEGAETRKEKLTFIDGYLRVDGVALRTLEYLRAYPEGTFYEFDPTAGIKESIENDEIVTKAKGLIYEMFENNLDEAKDLARATNRIDVNQKASFIQHDMLVWYSNPKNAKQLLADLNGKTLIKTKAAVQNLIEEKVISLKGNTVKGKNGEVIFTNDLNSDLVEAFTEYLHNKNTKLLEELKEKIKKPLKEEA
jgi:hypothetical protein